MAEFDPQRVILKIVWTAPIALPTMEPSGLNNPAGLPPFKTRSRGSQAYTMTTLQTGHATTKVEIII